MSHEYSLFRIIGNSLPPRHASGQNLKSVRFTLENEPPLEGAKKHWILNRIVSQEELDMLQDLIAEHDQECTVIPFDENAYLAACIDASGLEPELRPFPIRGQKIHPAAAIRRQEWLHRPKSDALININHARNLALKMGRAQARWTLPLDGEVIFTERGWKTFTETLAKERDAKFAVVTMIRIQDNERFFLDNEPIDPKQEPQLAFRNDTTDQFDERLRYGNMDKAELIRRIGVPGPWSSSWGYSFWDSYTAPASPDKDRFAWAGHVLRLSSGAKTNVEKSGAAKWIARFDGLAQMAMNLDIKLGTERFAAAEQPFAYNLPEKPSDELANRLATLCDEIMSRPIPTVLDKTELPPSGDPHDYHSCAPHWPNNAGRRDGQPVRKAIVESNESLAYDRTAFDRFIRGSTTLAVGGHLLGREDWSERAADLIRTWLVEPKTRMNPNLTYAQRVSGKNEGQPAGIIEVRDLWLLPDTVWLLEQSGCLSDDDGSAIRGWVTELVNHCFNSKNVVTALGQENSVGVWACATLSSLALQVGHMTRAIQLLRNAPCRLISQLGPAGINTVEMTRTRPLHYTLFNLAGWAALSRIAMSVGMKPTGYTGRDGQSLGSALESVTRTRDLFQEYEEGREPVETCLEALSLVLGRDTARSDKVITDGSLGLPPLWPALAPMPAEPVAQIGGV